MSTNLEPARPAPAQLSFYYGTMGCGKSATALQINHNLATSGRTGLIFTRHDRDGGRVSSRLGISHPATFVDDDLDFTEEIRRRLADGQRLEYLICDEAQFLTVEQVDQLARVVDEHDVEVYAFGLSTDFTGTLFDASKRLFELADERIELRVEARCWCGRRGSQNARVVAGEVVYAGEQIVVGDLGGAAEIHYELLCRRHWRGGVTASRAAERGLIVPPTD